MRGGQIAMLRKETVMQAHQMPAAVGIALCILLSLSASPAEAAPIVHRQYSWKATDGSSALLNHGRVVWQFNYGKDARKPYFHPVALIDGTVLTCPTPRD